MLLTQLVEREELARQLHVVNEPTTGQLHPDDDLAVGNHHGHRAKVDFQVLGQLLATRVTWVLITQEQSGIIRHVLLEAFSSNNINPAVIIAFYADHAAAARGKHAPSIK